MIKKIGIRNTLIYVFFLLVIYFTFIYKISVDTQRAEYTTYEDKTHFKGIYFANEQNIYTGSIENLGTLSVENASRVSVGTRIAPDLTSKFVGVLIHNLDGYENKYDLKNIKGLELSQMDNIIDNPNITPGLKIIESESLYIYAYIGRDGSFDKGQSFYISIGNNKYLCKVTDTISKKEGNFIILKLIEDINYKNLHRGITGDIIKSSHKGVLVSSDAVIVKGSEYKVFVKMPNGYSSLKSIDVIYDDGENAVVIPKGSDTIKEHDEVIINPPSILKDGLRVE